MEGSRSSKYKRGLGRAAWRRAHAVADTSPRRRNDRRRRADNKPPQGVYRRKFGDPQDQVWDAPFEFLGTVRNPRRRREPTPEPPDEPQRPQTPDPDDDPDPLLLAAALPRPYYARKERMNHDMEWAGSILHATNAWTYAIDTLVPIARGAAYGGRATSFIRLERLAFKIVASQSAIGLGITNGGSPLHADPVPRYNAMYFRFVVVYDKQSDGSDPTVTPPNVFISTPTYAINALRNVSNVERYEILHDVTFRWQLGEITIGTFSTVPGEFIPWYMISGSAHREEFFIDLDRLVHYSTDAGSVAAISSGNVFVMTAGFSDAYLTGSYFCNCRVTYSDRL